jgi:hypothetical protein
MLIPRPVSTLWIGESTSAALATMTVFSSSSASGEKRGLPLAAIFVELDEVIGSACRGEVAEGLRLGVRGTTTGTEAAVPGDEGTTHDGGGEDVRKISVAAAMMGAAALTFTPTLLSPNDTRRGCVSSDEERSDTGWLGGDGGG